MLPVKVVYGKLYKRGVVELETRPKDCDFFHGLVVKVTTDVLEAGTSCCWLIDPTPSRFGGRGRIGYYRRVLFHVL